MGTNNIPLEHQAIECDVYCIDCKICTLFTFEFLGGVGKLDRAGNYTNKYSEHYKQRKIKNTTLYLSDIYEIYYSMPGRWKARHYNPISHNCQKFAHLFWSQLFGSEEDDHGEWQCQSQYKCKCRTDNISVKKIRLIRVQKSCDKDFNYDATKMAMLNIITNKNENDMILHAIELQCKCQECETKIYYTLENSERGRYFRCGLYGKQLRPIREIQKRKSLNLKMVHDLYKMFTFKTTNNKKWTCFFWDSLFSQ